MRKILVLRGGALGDFIVTLPALALLRERWPDAQIELSGNATAGQLALARGLLDAVHSQHEARWSGLFAHALAPEFSAWLAEFDLVLSYWPDPTRELARKFPLRSGQVFLSGGAHPSEAPAAAHYCAPLRQLGIEPRQHYVRLKPLAADRGSEMGASLPPLAARPYIALHPGSGSPRKNWPMQKWGQLIRQLPAPVAVILGAAEAEPGIADLNRATRPARDGEPAVEETRVLELRNRPLEELVRHLAECRLFLGHDSGISHLAAACGAPCVLLFGPTDPAVWAPPAPRVQVLRQGAELNSIAVEDVRLAVEAALANLK